MGGYFSSPSKKSRLETLETTETNPVMENFLHLSNKKSVHETPVSNSPLLLKSPLVKRISPSKQFNDHSAHEKDESKTVAENFTPQSILKIRNLVRSSVSPVKHRVCADDLLSREQNRDKHNERICARQIRFSLPVSNDVEEQISSSTPVHTVKQDKTPNHVVKASARLPLRSSLSLLQKSPISIIEEVSSRSTTEKKSWIQKSPAKESFQKDVFVFGSTSLSTGLGAESDVNKMDAEEETYKINDSPGEDSFFSATSSNDSGTSKEDSKSDTEEHENSLSSKYIHNIKEIKPRRQLSRLKSGSQSLSDSYTSGQKEVIKYVETEKSFSRSELISSSHRTVYDACKKNTVIQSEVKHYEVTLEEDVDDESEESEDSEESDESDENNDKIVTNILSKKSMLGDSNIDFNNSTLSSETQPVSLDSSVTSIVENDDSIGNMSLDMKDEMSQRRKERPFTKLQQIQPRKPLSWARDSGNFNTFERSCLEMEKSSHLESTKDMKNVLMDDTHIRMFDGDEEQVKIQDNSDNLNEGDTETSDEEDTKADNDVRYSDILKEHKDDVSSTIQLESELPVSSCVSADTRSNLMRKENTIQSEENLKMSASAIKETYLQESPSVFVQNEYACQDIESMEGNDREKEIEVSNVELVSNCEKTYASLTAVSVEQTSYEPMQPFHQSDVNQGIATHSNDTRQEDQRNLLVVNPAEERIFPTVVTYSNSNVYESETHASGEDVCMVDDNQIIFEGATSYNRTLFGQNREDENHGNLILQDTSSSTGDTSGTIELDSDESEEKNIGTIMLQQAQLQPLTPMYQTKSISKDSYNERVDGADSLLSNRKDSCYESEIICIDSKEYKVVSKEQKHDRQGASFESNTNSENLDGNQDTNEGPVMLKLSDDENDFDVDSSKKKIEIDNASSVSIVPDIELNQNENTQFNKEGDDDKVVAVDSKHDTEKIINVDLAADGIENIHGNSEEQTVPNVVASPNVPIMEQSGASIFGEHLLVSKQKIHPSSAQSKPELTNLSECDDRDQYTETLQDCSGQIDVLRQESSLHGEPQQTGITFMSQDKRVVVTREEILTPRTRQGSRSNSVQSEPPLMADVTEIEHRNVETSQEHSGQIGRLRRRRSSLQIEPQQVGRESVFENKDELVATEKISTPRTRQSRPSSVQSEPHEMADVSEHEDKNFENLQGHSEQVDRSRRHSSLQFEAQQISDKSVSEIRDESVSEIRDELFVAEKISTPRTRQRSRPSSVQSESPEIADVSEHESKNKNVETLQDLSEPVSRSKRRSSLQLDAQQISGDSVPKIRDILIVTEEMSTPRTRQRNRPTSIQSEPPQMTDVSELENSIETSHKRSRKINKSGRRSLQIEPQQIDDVSMSENKDNVVAVRETFTPTTRQRGHPSSVQSEPPIMTDVSLERNETLDQRVHEQPSLMKSRRKNSLCSEHTKADDAREPQPSTSSICDDGNRMNLRSRRANSVDRELPNSRGRKKVSNIESISDSDECCSVQSEPPQLSDVSLIMKLRNARELLKKNKSRKVAYMLKMQPPLLPCLKEEPEFEVSVGDGELNELSAKSENEVPFTFTTTRNLRLRKHSEAASLTSSVGKRRVLRNRHEDKGDDSPVSISSKSTVIIDQSTKRKRCSSPSSLEEPHVKKFQKDEDCSTAAGRLADISSEKISPESKGTDSDHAIEQYATARRLTRYQKTLMERSMETVKGVRHKFHRRYDHSERNDDDDSDGESVASGFTSTSSQVRSSARLQERRLLMNRSPSQSSVMSAGHTPQKQVTKHRSHGTEGVEISPSSEWSPSSVSSSQWPSPSSHPSSSPLKPRQKAYQDAQKALSYSSTKKRTSSKSSAITTDTSEAESFSETNRGVSERKQSKKHFVSKSDTGSQSSAVSSVRSTRSSAKHIDTVETSESRKNKGGLSSPADVQPRRNLRQRKDTSSDVSSSAEDSPQKRTESQKGAAMSGNIDQCPVQESQNSVKPENRKSYSVFRKRKYLKIHSKRKTT